MISGMRVSIQSLNKEYLYNISNIEGEIDMTRYRYFINYYEMKMLQTQADNSKE